jgi:hypothetical protein
MDASAKEAGDRKIKIFQDRDHAAAMKPFD